MSVYTYSWRKKIEVFNAPINEENTYLFWRRRKLKEASVRYRTKDLLKDSLEIALSVLPEQRIKGVNKLIEACRINSCVIDSNLPNQMIGNFMVYAPFIDLPVSFSHFSMSDCWAKKFKDSPRYVSQHDLNSLFLPYFLLHRIKQWPGTIAYLHAAKQLLEMEDRFVLAPWKVEPPEWLGDIDPFDESARNRFLGGKGNIVYNPPKPTKEKLNSIDEWFCPPSQFISEFGPFLVGVLLKIFNEGNQVEKLLPVDSILEVRNGVESSEVNEILQQKKHTTPKKRISEDKIEMTTYIRAEAPASTDDKVKKDWASAKKLASILSLHSHKRLMKQRDLKEGKLDTNKLWKAPINDRIFCHRYEEPENRIKLLFLIDRSGSMSGSEFDVRRSMWVFLKAFDLLDFIEYKCYSYTSPSGSYCQTSQELISHTSESLGSYVASGVNADYVVFKEMEHSIKFDGTFNFFFTLGDSLANDIGTKDAVKDCGKVVSSLRKRGVICKNFAVSNFINIDHAEQIYGLGNCIVIKNTRDIYSQVRNTFLNSLREAERKQALLQ